MLACELGSAAIDGVDVTIDVVRESRGRSPRSTVRLINRNAHRQIENNPTIHEDCLGDIICVVPCNHMLNT